jgi:small subunit ribosomal protein S6
MATHELMVVIDGQRADEEIEALLAKIESLITGAGAEITHRDDWGRRRLAFAIKGKVDGFYALRVFTHAGRGDALMQEIERTARLEEAILRHLLTRLPRTKRPIPIVTKPEAHVDSRPDWGGARRGYRPPMRDRDREGDRDRPDRFREDRPREDRPDRGPEDRPAEPAEAAAPPADKES